MSLCHTWLSQNMFHSKPSSTCTIFNVGESSQTCILITQILATPQKIYHHVTVDVAPKVVGQTTPRMWPPPKPRTPLKVPTPKSQTTLSSWKEEKTTKIITPSKPLSQQNFLGKLQPTNEITHKCQMAYIVEKKVITNMTINPSKSLL
jgi:hypothetical protein